MGFENDFKSHQEHWASKFDAKTPATILLFGLLGSGKSTVGNRILGAPPGTTKEFFESGKSSKSVTKEPK